MVLGRVPSFNKLKPVTGHLLFSQSPVRNVSSLDYRLKNDEPLLTYLLKRTNYSKRLCVHVLYRLGFQQENLQTKISSLSGGEAIKITLAQLFIEPNNIILLDEPTNFLDLETIKALEEFISAYQGTVIFTSHDETFVEKVATALFI